MEKGFRYYVTDMGLLENPYEAGLGFAVKREKWPDINAGTKRRLRTLVVGGGEYLTIYGGVAGHQEGRGVRRLRSCAFGFPGRKKLSYTYLPGELNPCAQGAVEGFGRVRP